MNAREPETQVGTQNDERERLMAEVRRLEEEVRRKDDLYLRALADFDNYRKRVERDQAKAARWGKREVLLAFLDTLDGFDRALEHAKEAPASVLGGVQSIYRLLSTRLEAQGVTPFVSVGRPFDPRLHEAVDTGESDQQPGTVLDELQRGYRWGDEILRPARVRVAR